jgi:PIN domain nuclease of toxin-antitoxin system
VNLVVFDSSIVLAWLLRETGADQILPLIPNAVISSVNAAEAQTRLVRQGTDPKQAWRSIIDSVKEVIPFDATQAEVAGSLICHTEPYGLSLGDRACLALGLATHSPVYTADRAWAQLAVGVDVRLVR